MPESVPLPNRDSGASQWKFGTREVVLGGFFSAVVLVLQAIGIGSIPMPNLSGAMTTLLIPVILGAIIGGPWVGMMAGVTMGVVYLILPATAVFGPITLILPRIAMALVAWAIYRATRRFGALASVLSGILGSLTNTVCAVGLAILLKQVPVSIIALVFVQALIEMVGCAVMIPIVVSAVQTALKARGQS